LIESCWNVKKVFPKTGKRICQQESEKTNTANNRFDRTHSRDRAVGDGRLGPQLNFVTCNCNVMQLWRHQAI